MPEGDDEVQILNLLITPGHLDDSDLDLRITPAFEDELLALLDAEGINHSAILEFAEGPELAIQAVTVLSSAGGLAALASIIKTLVTRHNGKKITIGSGEVEIQGFDLDDIQKLLEQVARDKIRRDEEWKLMLAKQRYEVEGARTEDPGAGSPADT